MIRYALKCDAAHSFESWFQSATAFDGLRAGGHVSCPVCGSEKVEKELMAPAVTPARRKAADPSSGQTSDAAAKASSQARDMPAAQGVLRAPGSAAEAALAALRREVEANSDYVGSAFAREARAMHEGTAPERAIHGEARPEEARALLEEGVPILPLPFLPARRTN